MAIDKDKNTKILVTMPHGMLEEIEKYWHDHRLKNKSETIRELIRKGLESK